jgi:trans-aconitate 2-methyltransferase
MSVADFYDDYVDRQVSVGINARHRSILRFLVRFGMRADHRVLEIGAGVGTLTELIARELGPAGWLVATDLSPRSIEVARERLARFHNVELIAGDVLQLDFSDTFDVVVLPDVIEHIPLELHPELFRRVARWLRADGFVLLHYPNPHHLKWVSEHRPHMLQIVDQPVHADVLLATVYPAGMYLDYYERYSIWVREGDYIVAVLRAAAGIDTFTDLPEPRPSIFARLAARVSGMLRRRSSQEAARKEDSP